MNWLGALLAFWITIIAISPETFGRWMANVRNGYEKQRAKDK